MNSIVAQTARTGIIAHGFVMTAENIHALMMDIIATLLKNVQRIDRRANDG